MIDPGRENADEKAQKLQWTCQSQEQEAVWLKGVTGVTTSERQPRTSVNLDRHSENLNFKRYGKPLEDFEQQSDIN